MGYVYISFSLEDFKEVECKRSHRKVLKNTNIYMRHAGGHRLYQLYDGEVTSVMQIEDGSMWAIVELSDDFYGSPEYLLEEFTDEP